MGARHIPSSGDRHRSCNKLATYAAPTPTSSLENPRWRSLTWLWKAARDRGPSDDAVPCAAVLAHPVLRAGLGSLNDAGRVPASTGEPCRGGCQYTRLDSG